MTELAWALALVLLHIPGFGPTAGSESGTAVLEPGAAKQTVPVDLRTNGYIAYDWRVIDPDDAELLFREERSAATGATVLAEENTSSSRGRLTAVKEGRYALNWSNSLAVPVSFRFEVHAERIIGVPAAPAAAVVLTAMAAAAATRRRAG